MLGINAATGASSLPIIPVSVGVSICKLEQRDVAEDNEGNFEAVR
jgi:hypothetical protein